MREFIIALLTFFGIVGANAHFENGWRKFSQVEIDGLIQKEQHIFIKFDARWCLACKANDWVWNDPDIMKAFRDKRVHMFHADVTRKNPEATRALHAYGRQSLPTYILINGKTGKHKILYYSLSRDSIMEALNDL